MKKLLCQEEKQANRFALNKIFDDNYNDNILQLNTISINTVQDLSSKYLINESFIYGQFTKSSSYKESAGSTFSWIPKKRYKISYLM